MKIEAKKPELLLILFLLIGGLLSAQNLGRRALWQAKITLSEGGPGATIQSFQKNSPLEREGFLPGDRLIRVNGISILDEEIWSDIFYGLRGDTPIQIEAVRNGSLIKKEVRFDPLEMESHKNLETFYEEVTSTYGITQRTIITKPQKKGKQPAIVLIGGLSCSSIETYPGRKGNWVQTITDLVEKSGMVVMRIEKPGVGDSDGDCGQSDFLMDLAGYRAAIRSLKSKPYVDPNKIVVYGSSMGSALAPLLANEFSLAGVISDGTFFKTWYEHMLEIERRILQFQGNTEAEIVEKMNDYFIPLYYGMLIEKKTYQEVVDAYPALAKFNYHGPAHMYGRPVRYYQQLQDFNLAGQWEKLKVPVRILRGTNDWIMSSFDNQMILEVLKRNGHSDHKLLEYPGLDHWNTIHETAKNSFEGKEGKWDEGTILAIIEWAQEMVSLQP
ncbi:alpha/beta fold hydrolase [Ulvibacterium marinum]|uniref:Alpha/beta fold hydrolase n=1 Tax=Ulvibacterium marinum TaxID=2419782 RepID=A0A3B0CFV2_9FLAO|nr:alpha/beta hydrolase [Ulvibacterium marinum]RKN83039.1 alpha/beta fold hydrolase [Ulvibacterium marinum]